MSFQIQNLQKNQLLLIGGVGVVLLLGIIFYSARPDTSVKLISPQNSSNVPAITDRDAPTQDYFKGTTHVATSSEEAELQKKMEERGQIQALQLGFTEGGFKSTTPENLVLKGSTMTKFDLDTSNTGVASGTKLILSIPAANLRSQIALPGQYSFLITFNKTGPQEVILEGEGLRGGKIQKTITIQ